MPRIFRRILSFKELVHGNPVGQTSGRIFKINWRNEMEQDKFCCDYEVSQIEDDVRFTLCRKDMVLVQISYLGYTMLLILLSYWLCPKDVADMTYLFGLPLWAAAAFLLTGAFTALIIVWAVKGPSFSLDAREENKRSKEI